MVPSVDRRDVLTSLFALAGASWRRSARPTKHPLPPGPDTRLILLGTGGGASPKRRRSAPAQAIVTREGAVVIDCGDGVARQLVLAGVPIVSLRAVFITHHHSDHNADYGNLLLLAWAAGLDHAVDAYGPPPLDRMTQLFLEMNAVDIETRIADEGRTTLAPLVRVHEIREGGAIPFEGLKVSAALNEHPPIRPSFAYRFDGPDRSIVISGDTIPSAAVVKLAAGADVLVHEVMYVPALGVLVSDDPRAARLREHLLASHTSAEDVGKVAAAAGVGTLVLTHFVPGDEPIDDDVWRDAAARHFKGKIIVGRDLMVI
jgi:ribonuclease BN (tRNA processing enzyme)